MEHLRRSFNYTCTHLGPHGLPLIGRADWNDCLNLNCFSEHPGESFQITGPSEGPVAESVFIAGMFVKYGHEYAELCDHLGLDTEAAAARQTIDAVEQAALTAGWDGAWFRRAYDAFGPRRQQGVRRGSDLYRAAGHVRHGRHRQGDRTGRAGACQRGGAAGHQIRCGAAAARLHQLSAESGRDLQLSSGIQGERRYLLPQQPVDQLRRGSAGPRRPRLCGLPQDLPRLHRGHLEIHRTEPYVYSQMVAGKDAPTFGEAKNSWLTGTAAWTFFNISQYILGIQPTWTACALTPASPTPAASVAGYNRQHGVKAVTVGRSALLCA